jgi:RNA polymerase sigma-70 factor (ECF subfamily)
MTLDACPKHAPDSIPPDADLLARSATGDGAAFGVLVRRHLRTATALALDIVGNLDDAEDVVQEAFLVTLDRARTFDAARPFASWLLGIVRNKAIRQRTRAARRRRLLRLFGWPEPTVMQEERVDAEATMARARVLLDALPEMQRRCFDLHVSLGLPTPVVAERCGIAESTVRQHVFRARAALRRALDNGSVA